MKGSANLLKNVEWLKFSAFPLFSLSALIMMLVRFDGIRDEKQMNALIFFAFGLLFLNILTFYLLWDALNREQRFLKQKLSVERAKSETMIYQQISENFAQQKKREHEYKNQMMVLSTLLKQKEFEKLNILLGKYSEEIAQKLDAIDTNHIIVNAILNAKYQEAKEKGIVFVLKVNDLSKLKMEEQDVVVILSNMLNNAIEACEKCIGRKIIRVKIVQEENKTIFSVINTFGEKPCCVDGKYKTTKTGDYHGMGIENIKEIVRKYGGTCAIRYDKEWFYFVVYFS